MADGKQFRRPLNCNRNGCGHGARYCFTASGAASHLPLYSARNFTAAQAARTCINVTRRPVDDSRDALDIRLPHAVAAPVRVADFYPELYAFVTKLTLCHLLHLLDTFSNSASNTIRPRRRMQEQFFSVIKNLQKTAGMYTLVGVRSQELGVGN